MATAAEQWYSEAAMHGVSEAVHRAGVAHGQRRYEEGRDGAQQRQRRFWEKVLAEMRSGVQPPVDAAGMQELLKLAERA